MTDSSLNERLRNLPSVDDILNNDHLDSLRRIMPHDVMTDVIRNVLDNAREDIRSDNKTNPAEYNAEALAVKTAFTAEQMLSPSLRRVINATGVIIHTNLGRSVLAQTAIDGATQAARSYSTLEYNIKEMCRGSRHDHYEQLICALTGAEAAIAVNNNAAAVLMVLSEFASGKEAIVSRGELIEIGGSFRIPDIMELSHARMIEVGTTNKTHISDYEQAITDNTAMLLKVHTSNYCLVGFTESVSGHDLRRVADAASKKRIKQNSGASPILVYEDLGSGALLDLFDNDEHIEPTVKDALASGCDLVSFSGDKLLGGPQAGIIVGSKKLIERLKKNPLARVVRLDKMTLAALEATLRLYLNPDRAREEIPTLAMLNITAEEVRKQAEKLAECIKKNVPKDCIDVDVIPEISRAGGGSLPMQDIETYVVQVSFKKGAAQECEEYLIRQSATPIIARIKQETVLFDPRTLIESSEIDEIAHALADYFAHITKNHTRKTNASKPTGSASKSSQRSTSAKQSGTTSAKQSGTKNK